MRANERAQRLALLPIAAEICDIPCFKEDEDIVARLPKYMPAEEAIEEAR